MLLARQTQKVVNYKLKYNFESNSQLKFHNLKNIILVISRLQFALKIIKLQ
jgi:hypothetical protein